MKLAIIARNDDILPTSKTRPWAPGIVIANEARVLTKLGQDFRIYCAKGSKVEGEVVDFGMPSAAVVFSDLDQPQKNIRNEYFNSVYQLKVIEHLRKNPVDILHLHTFRDFPIYEEANLDIPIVVTLHNDFFHSFEQMPDYLRTLINQIKIIAISKTTKIPTGIKPPFAIIPNILDLKSFEFIPKPKNRVVHAGRLIYNKGPDLAIEAARLAKIDISIYGKEFGTIDWEGTMLKIFNQSSHAKFHGFVPYDEINQAFDAKALLLPMRKPEGMGNVVLEAMASGTPVITFGLGGTKDLIKDGVNGYLIEPGNVEAMAAAIKRVDEIDRLKCRKYVLKRFDELKLGRQLIEVFQKAINDFKIV